MGPPLVQRMSIDDFSKYSDRLRHHYRAAYLIYGFISSNLTMEEEEELDRWILENEDNMRVFEYLTDERRVPEFLDWYYERNTEEKLRVVKKRLGFGKTSVFRMGWQYAAAASFLLILGIGIYFFYNKISSPAHNNLEASVNKDILPGASKAVLKMNDGREVFLENAKDTVINDQVSIQNGEIVYSDKIAPASIHEVSIPRKGFYKVLLPDGTKVWLNSESSIKYPSVFSGNERRVSVSGETYFEVAKDASKPFIVSVNGMEVIAVGTAFNINTFDKIVTLTEGVIKVREEDKSITLHPGEQLDAEWRLKNVDISPATAWTRNEFKFKNETIDQIIPRLQRWYGCNVKYEARNNFHFNGTIDRTVPVSRVLQLLEGTGDIAFDIAGDTIIVKK